MPKDSPWEQQILKAEKGPRPDFPDGDLSSRYGCVTAGETRGSAAGRYSPVDGADIVAAQLNKKNDKNRELYGAAVRLKCQMTGGSATEGKE